jgi:hypothetical protein
MKKVLYDQIKQSAFQDELDKLAAKKKKHPVSEAQRRWAFAAEEKGELPEGKAMKWSKRAKGKDLPKHSKQHEQKKEAGMNQEQYDKIVKSAFDDEMKKIAGQTSELAGTGTSGIIGAPLAAAAGYHFGGAHKTEGSLRRAESKGASNVLIPFVGPYRLGRRLATQKANPEMYSKVMKSISKEKEDIKAAKQTLKGKYSK